MKIWLPQERIKILVQKMLLWRDEEAKELLIDAGLLVPIPKEQIHGLMHGPEKFHFKCLECWKDKFL